MEISKCGGFYHVTPHDPVESTKIKRQLMGWKQKKGSPFIVAEDNLVNRMILHQPIEYLLAEGHVIGKDDRLKDYQEEDVIFMDSLRHTLNANPMGLGKTIETIKVLSVASAKSVCIVTPKIIREQWVSQIKEWWGRDAIIYEKQPSLHPGNIYIVNYDKLRNEQTLIKFKQFRWDFLVLDEAHKIKSRTSKQSIAVKQIPSTRKMALTGTPILKYVDDLWSILNFFGPWYSGKSYWTFADYFCKIEKTPWGNKIVGTTDNEDHQKILKKMLYKFMVRHEAVEVAHGKTIDVVKLPMSKAQRELYKREKQLLLDKLPENCTIANGAVLAMRLRQTTSWPGLFLEKEHGPKFAWILENCLNNPKEQFVVFTAFEQTAEALHSYLLSKKVTSGTITGKHVACVNSNNKLRFLQKKDQVLIGTIGAMGQGYDGLQKVSRIVIFVDRDWSPELMKQAEDRLHRMGQEYPVQVYYLECQGSFDQHVGRINMNKTEGIRRALEIEEEN